MAVETKIHVSNISRNVRKEHLQDIFETYGKVRTAEVAEDRHGAPRGFAYVDFEDWESAKKAVSYMNGVSGAPYPHE
jgi:RNA recognition motif-containing protein